MHVIVDFTVVPVGAGISLSGYIAACEKILAESGLTYELHANGTNVEGEWEDVFTAIRRCHETLHAMGVPRIHTDIKLGTRTDRAQTMADKIASVREK
ncbi:MAG: MTH1187 family thiamine-binding protein [Chloroflexi bacterium]|nr:MTH1187 family thiamine-binding protein [Chloroflexota bacterium]